MPSFTMEAQIHVLNPDDFDNIVGLWQKAVMRAAVRRFIAATLKRIPVRTGFLRGSFSAIRAYFRDQHEDPSVPTVSRAPLKRKRQEWYVSGATKVLKTTTSGVQFATPPSEVLTYTDTTAFFHLDINIDYFRINDFYAKIAGAPWESLKEGTAAMTNYLNKVAETFPDITEILALQTIRLRGTTISQLENPANYASQRFLQITGF